MQNVIAINSAARQSIIAAQATSDEMLLQSIADGNRTAMHTLYARHNVRVYRFILRIVRDTTTDVPPLMDHWSIAGPTIQAKASVGARQMLGADDRPPDVTWAVLPDGWVSARRAVDVPLSERKLPTEQQGYQRLSRRVGR